MEDYEGIVGEVYSEAKEVPQELVEAQRIQLDPVYGMKVRHERELEKIAETATAEEQLIMAKKFDFSVLITAMWEIYSKEHELNDRIRGYLNET